MTFLDISIDYGDQTIIKFPSERTGQHPGDRLT